MHVTLPVQCRGLAAVVASSPTVPHLSQAGTALVPLAAEGGGVGQPDAHLQDLHQFMVPPVGVGNINTLQVAWDSHRDRLYSFQDRLSLRR